MNFRSRSLQWTAAVAGLFLCGIVRSRAHGTLASAASFVDHGGSPAPPALLYVSHITMRRLTFNVNKYYSNVYGGGTTADDGVFIYPGRSGPISEARLETWRDGSEDAEIFMRLPLQRQQLVHRPVRSVGEWEANPTLVERVRCEAAAQSLLLRAVKSDDDVPWSGPTVRNAWQRGFPRFSVDGALSLPHWLYPAPGKSGDLAIQAAAKVGIEVFTVQVRLASLLKANSTGMVQIRRVLQLLPQAKILLRVNVGAWINETAAMMVLRDASGAQLSCKAGACAAVNSWTSSWIVRTSTALESMLRQIDTTFPGKVFGVWLTAGVSGEWNYGTNADYSFFPDYNSALVREFCAVAGCAGAPNVSSRDAPNLGNRFITSDTPDGAAAVAWNRFLNERVTTAISALCNATKHASGGKAWCGAFHGCEQLSLTPDAWYSTRIESRLTDGVATDLYNSANLLPFSGHLGMSELLRLPHIDAIGTPWLYFNASQAPAWGASLPQGPWDSPKLHAKMWIVEDDQRTFFSPQGPTFKYCWNIAETSEKLRRNWLTAAMHGNGLYLFDQKEFYANVSEPAATRQLWQGVAADRVASSRLDRYSTVILEPEVAIFTDDVSALHWTVSSGAHHGTEDQRPDPNVAWPAADPLSWNQLLVIDPFLSLGTLGAPLRHYTLSDLRDLPPCTNQAIPAGCIPLQSIRMAVFTNAHRLDRDTWHAIASKLQNDNRTIVLLYTAGAITASGGGATNGGAGALADLVGAAAGSVELGNGGRSLRVQVPNLPAPYGPPQQISPWYKFHETAAPQAQMEVLGRFADGVESPALPALVRWTHAKHRAVFSAAPALPTQLWRDLARAAGVTCYLGDSDAVVEVGGGALMVRGAPTHWQPWINREASSDLRDGRSCRVELPPAAGLVRVEDDIGREMCASCTAFDDCIALNATRLYFVSRPAEGYIANATVGPTPDENTKFSRHR